MSHRSLLSLEGLALTTGGATVDVIGSVTSVLVLGSDEGCFALERVLVVGSARTRLLLAALAPTRLVFAVGERVRSIRLGRRCAGKNWSATDLPSAGNDA